MFSTENTCGFSERDIGIMNDAVRVLEMRGIATKNACDIVNNNWQETENTVESLAEMSIKL